MNATKARSYRAHSFVELELSSIGVERNWMILYSLRAPASGGGNGVAGQRPRGRGHNKSSRDRCRLDADHACRGYGHVGVILPDPRSRVTVDLHNWRMYVR